MNHIFFSCSSLTTLDLCNFNTNNVKDIHYCSSLISLNLSNFNTNKDTKMSEIFFTINKSCKIISNDQRVINLLNNRVKL